MVVVLGSRLEGVARAFPEFGSAVQDLNFYPYLPIEIVSHGFERLSRLCQGHSYLPQCFPTHPAHFLSCVCVWWEGVSRMREAGSFVLF